MATLSAREQIIYDAWNDPKQGFVSASALFRKLRDSHPQLGLKAKEVHEVLGRIARRQQFQSVGKTTYDTISAPTIRDSYQVDLADMQNLKKQNDNFGYVLLCIDVHSRYALWLPCKTKTTKDVKACLQSVFQTMGKPINLTSDFESAIVSIKVQAWLTQEGIRHWPVKDERKRNNAMVERLIRTMREKMRRAFSSYGTRRWIGPMISDLNDSYNNSYHSSIKATPQEVWDGEASAAEPVKHHYPFQIGNRVRVRKITGFKDPLLKTSTLKTWSKTIYTITGRNLRRYVVTNPKNGSTQDRMGYELQLVPADTIDFEPPKDSVYTVKKQTGKQAREEKRQLQREQELEREEILEKNVQETTKRLRTILATEAAEKRRQQRELARLAKPKRVSAPRMRLVIEKFTNRRKNPVTGRVEYLVRWRGYKPSDDTWEARAFLANPKKSGLKGLQLKKLEDQFKAKQAA